MRLVWSIEELAGYALEFSESEVDEMLDNKTVNELLYEKYGVEFTTYIKIIKDLLPLTPVVEGGIEGTKFHAFVVDNRMIVKQKVEE